MQTATIYVHIYTYRVNYVALCKLLLQNGAREFGLEILLRISIKWTQRATRDVDFNESSENGFTLISA